MEGINADHRVDPRLLDDPDMVDEVGDSLSRRVNSPWYRKDQR
jgi:hypothetical protein